MEHTEAPVGGAGPAVSRVDEPERAPERDDLADERGTGAGELASEDAAQAPAHQADRSPRGPVQLFKPCSHPGEDGRRGPQVATQPPAVHVMPERAEVH